MKKSTLWVIAAIVAVLLLLLWRGKYAESYIPIYCSSRSDTCTDLGSREQVSYG